MIAEALPPSKPRRVLVLTAAIAANACTIGSHIGRRVATPVVVSEPVVRFAVLGDAGTGQPEQRAVAELMRRHCADCAFALALGDNVYWSGADSANDEQFVERFEDPYRRLRFPFYLAMGNHDYGLWGTAPPSIAERKARHAIEYTKHNPRWILPAQYYAFDVSTQSSPRLARFVALDTPRIAWHTDEEQQRWVAAKLASGDYHWRIAFGHHPYVSSGRHGHAGSWGDDVLSGDDFRDFVESHLCGHADVYFCGHDHLLEWRRPQCGTEFVVSGAGGKFDPPARAEDSLFVSQGEAGFLLVELSDDRLVGTFHTTRGTKFRRIVRRTGPSSTH